MKEVLFIQFYSKTSYPPICYELGNGFSDTYDLCKSKGDFHWVRHYYNQEPDTKFLIEKGTAYISALYVEHLYRSYLWAKRYPKVKFIVGGPATIDCSVTEFLPSNLILTKKSVEDYFGVPNFTGKWKLEIPEEIPKDNTIYFTYILDNMCYWKKCTFCSCTIENNNFIPRIRKDINFEFKDINYSGIKMIRLGTEAVMSDHIKILPNVPLLNNLNGYRVFLRAGKEELRVLKTLNNMDWVEVVRFNIGLEFPTARMWKSMKKGYDKDTVLDILNILKKKFCIKMILGWNNLIKEDLIELESFMKMIPDGTDRDCGLKTGELYAIQGTNIHETYEKGRVDTLGPFYIGFKPKLSRDQIKLNKEAQQIMVNYAIEKKYDVLDLCEFKGDL